MSSPKMTFYLKLTKARLRFCEFRQGLLFYVFRKGALIRSCKRPLEIAVCQACEQPRTCLWALASRKVLVGTALD